MRTIKTAISNIRSNRQVFWVSIGTITIVFAIIGLFLIIFVNMNSFLKTWNEQVQLIVYLDDGVTQVQRNSLEALMKHSAEIEKFDFVSKESAWEDFKTTFSEKSDFISDLEFNPLPASYNIKFHGSNDRLEAIKSFADKIGGFQGVESLDYGAKWISGFEKFMLFLRFFLLAVGGLVGLGLILIVSNTIRLSFFSRKDEVELMVLLGATPGFIKLPFLLEGMIQGLLGSIFGLVLVKIAHWYMESKFLGSLDSVARGFSFHFLSQPIVLYMILGGAVIGFIGSELSISKTLNGEINL
jgi:cell division transport system permease protein